MHGCSARAELPAACSVSVFAGLIVRRTGCVGYAGPEDDLCWSNKCAERRAICSHTTCFWSVRVHRRNAAEKKNCTQDPSRCRWDGFERRAPLQPYQVSGIIDIQKNNFCARFLQPQNARNSQLSSATLRFRTDLESTGSTALISTCRSSTSSPNIS